MPKKYQKKIVQKQTLQQNYDGLTPQQKVKKYLGTIQQKLVDDLDNQSIIIPKKQKPYIVQTQKKQKRQYSYQDLKKIKTQKQQAFKRLEQINQKQKRYHRDKEKYNKSLSPIRPKSQLTNDDIQVLNKLKKEYKNFQKQLQEKDKFLQQKEIMLKLQESQLIQKKKKQDGEKRKIKITKRLEEMQRKKKDRYNRVEQEKQIIARLRNKKKIQDQLKFRTERQQLLQQQNMKKKILQCKLKQRTIDYDDIKEHERKYQEMRRKNKQQIQRKRIQFSRLSHNLSQIQKYPKSKFYESHMEEEKKNKQISQGLKQDQIKKRKKMLQYSNKVQRQFAPTLKPNSEQNQLQIEMIGIKKQKNIPTSQEAKILGLHFLQLSKAKANKSRNKRKDKTISNPQQNKAIIKYPNYLIESKKEKISLQQKSYKNQINEVKKIMRMKNYSNKQKFERVKIMTQKIQQDSSNNKSSSLVKKIAAKLQIIQTIY